MVEGTGLENQQGRKSLVRSNRTASAHLAIRFSIKQSPHRAGIFHTSYLLFRTSFAWCFHHPFKIPNINELRGGRFLIGLFLFLGFIRS